MGLIIIPGPLLLLLSYVANWADVATFIGLEYLLSAHITDNTVVFSAQLAEAADHFPLLPAIVNAPKRLQKPLFGIGADDRHTDMPRTRLRSAAFIESHWPERPLRSSD